MSIDEWIAIKDRVLNSTDIEETAEILMEGFNITISAPPDVSTSDKVELALLLWEIPDLKFLWNLAKGL